MNAPPWMSFAWADLHVAEAPGTPDNPRIVDYFRRVGHADVDNDATPWCAAYVGACLERAGLRSTRSLAARSYLAWGVDTVAPPTAPSSSSRAAPTPRSVTSASSWV